MKKIIFIRTIFSFFFIVFKKWKNRKMAYLSGSVHTSANLIFHFSNKNGKRKCYLSLSYLYILMYGQK